MSPAERTALTALALAEAAVAPALASGEHRGAHKDLDAARYALGEWRRSLPTDGSQADAWERCLRGSARAYELESMLLESAS